MNNVGNLIITLLFTGLFWSVYITIRTEWAYTNTLKYLHATHDYLNANIDEINTDELIKCYDSLTEYDDVMNDWFNWSQKQFVTDPELFKKLQKYL